MNKIGNQYLKQVKSHLTCPAALKKTFLEQIRGDVEEFLETNPDATLEVLTVRFGEPNQMACSYLDGLDGNELQKQIKKAKIVKRIVLFTCLGILLLVLAAAAYITIETIKDDTATVTYIVEETVISEESNVPKEEALNSYVISSSTVPVDEQQSETTQLVEEIVES